MSAPVLDVGTAAGTLSRDVSESVMKALAATVEAISHFRSSGSLSGFDAGVREGISYESSPPGTSSRSGHHVAVLVG
ncbi:hypothetical protein SVIO_065490 [Streptomyces violaceusniger]|uniref:Uncharacterized protein n=1 Tax=Streptomyces violaceusniger TaxID=68280 RepID=A0A4D4L9Q9_STRVO|nr:hypothetical protein SVIO_065490 [Streptomyces violaceusniger]